MFNKVFILLLAIGLPLCGYAELRDPTQPNYPVPAVKTSSIKTPALAEALPKLSAIWITANSKRATLNGITAHEGQTILNNVQIITISANQVVIKQNNRLKTLQLLQHSVKSRNAL